MVGKQDFQIRKRRFIELYQPIPVRPSINLLHISLIYTMKQHFLNSFIHARFAHFGFIFLCLFITGSARSQFIQNLRVEPPQPVAGDTVRVLADVLFQSGDCVEKSLFLNQTGSFRYEATALHCLGLLTVICYDTDTFALGSLPAGAYRFVYEVNAGFGPSPCTPGIIPGSADSIDFTVSPATGSTELQGTPESFVFPNPTSGNVWVSGLQAGESTYFSLTGLSGNAIFVRGECMFNEPIDLEALPSGVYLLQTWTENKAIARTKIIRQ